MREEKVPYLLVGLEEGHYVVKWHGSRPSFPSIPPLTTILVINLSLLTSFSFFSSLTIQSSRGPLSVLSYSLGSIMSLTQSLFFSLFLLALTSPARVSKMDHYRNPSNLGVFLVFLWTCTHLYCTCLNAPVPCV